MCCDCHARLETREMGQRRTRLVLLGTAGGPWPAPERSGISQALVVGDRAYVVDCGTGVARQLVRAGLLRKLQAVFVTHLHSDHVCDLFNLFLLGWSVIEQQHRPIAVYGPGSAGTPVSLPAAEPDSARGSSGSPTDPTPGLSGLMAKQFQAYAYDLSVRMRGAGRVDLATLVTAHEITVPEPFGADRSGVTDPLMNPFVVAEDDRVRVTAILVRHPPVFPSFAFRFDTEDGSVVLSGDTAPSANLVRLAIGADILVHEVVDAHHMRRVVGREPLALARLTGLLASHTSLEDVGAIATQAGVGKLVLTHFIPTYPHFPDEHWTRGASRHYAGELLVGFDLAEVPL